VTKIKKREARKRGDGPGELLQGVMVNLYSNSNNKRLKHSQRWQRSLRLPRKTKKVKKIKVKMPKPSSLATYASKLSRVAIKSCSMSKQQDTH